METRRWQVETISRHGFVKSLLYSIIFKSRKANAQHAVLCNWGLTVVQSSAVHIQALYPADGILPGSSFKLQLLVINLASVPGGQLVNTPTAQSPTRCKQFL